MPNYELPTNDDFEKLINTNLNNTKPLNMKTVNTMDGKKIFPFWTPVSDRMSETTVDYTNYLDNQEKKKRELKISDKTDCIKPITTFISKNGDVENNNTDYEDHTIMGNMKKLIDKINSTVLPDKTNAVKPKATFKTGSVDNNGNTKTKTVELGTANMSVKPQTNTAVDSTNEVKTVSNAASGSVSTGVVKPKSDIGTQSVPDISKTGKNVQANKDIVLNDKTGAVKPKSSFHETDSNKKITTKPTTSTGSTPDIKTKTTVVNDKTGVVKPKADMEKQNIPNIAKGTPKIASDLTDKTGVVKIKK